MNRTLLFKSFLLLGMVALTIGAVYRFRITEASESGVVMNLPSSVGNYIGFDQDSELERAALPKDTEFAKKLYIGSWPGEIVCQIVLSGAQRSSIHRPQYCLVGQGWFIDREHSLPLKLKDGRIQKVRILELSRFSNGQRYGGYFVYWFVGKNKTTDDHLDRMLLTSWDRVAHYVNHRWAYVIVNSTYREDMVNQEQKQAILQGLLNFAREIIPQIQRPNVNQTLASK